MLIFHNCFGDFPAKPDINIEKNINRFYYACMGWLIRNPFYNWVQSEFYSKGIDSDEIKERYLAIEKGGKSASEYFNDKRFLKLPKTFKMAYENLDKTINKFHRLIDSWDKFKSLL